MKIVVLTGNEIRHKYFRKKISNDSRFDVIASFCEGVENSLEQRTYTNSKSSPLEKLHVDSRTLSELDYFQNTIDLIDDNSDVINISKGSINDDDVVKNILNMNPDILVCYGSSLINSKLISLFNRKFLNVHLGLSPYYRGSGTNIWPLINKEPHMVGATFMHIDEGIDTGEIIHQIQGDIYLGDGPHSIGNRLIKKMVDTYSDIIANFQTLTKEKQPDAVGKLYFEKNFDKNSCDLLYENFKTGMIDDYVKDFDKSKVPYLVKNEGLVS